MSGFDGVIEIQMSKYRIPGEVKGAVDKYLKPKDVSQTMDEAFEKYSEAVKFIGDDPGGFTDSDKTSYRHFLEKYFDEKVDA